MKIGILTFHNVANYGGVLQCYALQEKLKKLGCEVEIINYQNEYFKRFYNPFFIQEKNLRKIGFMLYIWPQKLLRNKKFNKFINSYLTLSKESYTDQNIQDTDGKYDVIITGSDQVWNLELTHNDKSYLLDYVKKSVKASYAASFGFEKFPERLKDEYTTLLESFNYISVRENTGKKIIDEIMNKEVSVHIDPVFLLTREEWKKVASSDKNEHDKYICVYKINQSDCYKTAKELSEKTGYKVVVIKGDKTCPKSFIRKKYADPKEFLQIFNNSEFVITDSFHGTSFSILLNKQFLICLDQRKENRNTRLLNVLEMTNLSSRICIGKDIQKQMDKEINYVEVNSLINKKRIESEIYLKDVIENGRKR